MVDKYPAQLIEQRILWIEKELLEILKEKILLHQSFDDEIHEAYIEGIEDAIDEMREAFMIYFPEIAAKRAAQ